MKKNTKVGFGIAMMVPFLLFIFIMFVKEISFEQDVRGHLKLAADANSQEFAIQELNKAIVGIEQRRLTSGSSSVLWHTPACDLDFWYLNIKQSRDDLVKLKNSQITDPLAVSNQLMKLRETLLDSSDGETTVTAPPWSVYHPFQFGFILWGIVSFIMLGVGMLICGAAFMDP